MLCVRTELGRFAGRSESMSSTLLFTLHASHNFVVGERLLSHFAEGGTI